MALFSFIDLQPTPATPALRDALDVSADEPLLARRLRGSGKWDRGRRVVEVIVPARMPQEVNLRAEGLLCDNLDFVAPHFKYGEYHLSDLQTELGASELVVLHDWAHAQMPEYAVDKTAPAGEVPGLVLVSESEDEYLHNFAVQVFFNPPRLRSELRRLVMRPYRAVRRAYLASRPGEAWWLKVGRS